jgi:hypothetical protein
MQIGELSLPDLLCILKYKLNTSNIMNGFFQKNKTWIMIVLALLLLIGLGLGVYFFVLDQDLSFFTKEGENVEEVDEEGQEQPPAQGDTVSPMPDYDERSSGEAIDATYVAAKAWADDVELYNCTGIPTSVQFEDITYEYIGAEDGKYYRWMCTYYSQGKEQTKIFAYVGGELEDDTEALDIGEYQGTMYNSIDYPTDLDNVVESTVIYADALENGLDEENYVNMYLGDSIDYGYVWKVEERSRTEKDEYDIGVLENTYIYDINTGDLDDITQEEVY